MHKRPFFTGKIKLARASQWLLDTREGTINWGGAEDDGFEEIRPITDQGDAFEPSFELDTNEHAEWVRAAIAKYEE